MGTLVAGGVVLAMVAWAIKTLKKEGIGCSGCKGGCSGNCAGCSHCSHESHTK